ncbi:hypothetical protein [Streptomyces uncialis]|uniref:hypothetical protein n=1 Tax=Streptomyces uncialis TaxID=1048205 RepID=UPI0034102244
MITATEVIRRSGVNGPMPLLTLDEFFDGNTDEECVAPQQWGHGRPPLAELTSRLREIERREDVLWVRVQLQSATLETRTLTAQAIAVCTSADEAACAEWVDGFEADVFLGLVDAYRDVPKAPQGTYVWSVVWE